MLKTASLTAIPTSDCVESGYVAISPSSVIIWASVERPIPIVSLIVPYLEIVVCGSFY